MTDPNANAVKALIVSDCGVPTGYGRIADQVGVRLAKRGLQIYAASYAYDGLLPASYEGQPLPYPVASLAGKPNWPELVAQLVTVIQPDVVLSIQDFPYAQAIKAAPLIDWSKHAFIVLTPVDGVPIYPEWLDVMKGADAGLTISEFGVEAFRQAGIAVSLCRPGVDGNVFFKLPAEARARIRAALGVADDGFLVGTAAMNQGRKCISLMLKAFFEFAADKPNARYLLDMDPISPAGWNLPALCRQYGYDASKLIFRADAERAGVLQLKDRFNALDAHMVISHREGYGLPLAEAMACGVVSMALDYCSGTEICGEGRGILIKETGYRVPGTWGGAEDAFPDLHDLAQKLQWLYDHPAERAALAERGMEWARAQTWDAAADAVHAAIGRVIERRAALPPANVPMHAIMQNSVQNGVQSVVQNGANGANPLHDNVQTLGQPKHDPLPASGARMDVPDGTQTIALRES